MVVLNAAYLIIQAGDPHPPDTRIMISNREFVLGRSAQQNHPDISFTNPLISRKHAMIITKEGIFSIVDLASKHGTQVNSIELEPLVEFSLHYGDLISLARGAVNIIFIDAEVFDIDATVDLASYLQSQSLPRSNNDRLSINLKRREVLMDGVSLNLSGKDLDLLLYLYANQNNAVSYDQIRIAVWAERSRSSGECVPDVGSDEISALVYRLRKRLGEVGSLIVTIPRFGYRLDM